jgi:hypothetical protein
MVNWVNDAEKLARLYEYCRQDVRAERAVQKRIGFLPAAEQKVWELNTNINDRGIYLDSELLDGALRIAAEAEAENAGNIAELTGGAVPTINNVAKLIAWLREHGCDLPDVRKKTLQSALAREDASSGAERHLTPEVRRALELRQAGAHAAARKFVTMKAWRGADGRARGAFKYHGAATGRFASWGIQVHNLKRPVTEDLNGAITAVSSGSLQHVKERFTDPLAVVGDIGRAVLCAAPGSRFLAADYSGIESRTTAWLAGEQRKVNQWAKFDATGNPKYEPYYLLGIQLGLPEETARAIGKVCDLAFGYMGSVGAYRALDHKTTLTDDEIQKLKHRWRDEHPNIVRFWKMLVRASVRAMNQPGVTIPCGRLSFTYDGEMFLRMRLPSGRDLAYPAPWISLDEILHEQTVVFKDNARGGFVDCRDGRGAYGGTWIENAVQALARDVFTEAMQRLEAAGYPVVMHAHDEIVCELPVGVGTKEEFHKIMTAAPAWAAGLPIAAKAHNSDRFAKIKPRDASPHASGPALVRQSETNSTPEPEILQLFSQNPIEETIMEAKPVLDLPHIDDAPATGFDADSAQAAEDWFRKKANGHSRDASTGASGKTDGSQCNANPGKRGPVAEFGYHRADGTPYILVKKYDWFDNKGKRQKPFVPYHLENNKWVKGEPAGPSIPYRLPQLLAAPQDTQIHIMEGEKDADRAAGLGLIATTNQGGAKRWPDELNEYFRGRRVVVHEDNDEAGRHSTAKVGAALRGIVGEILVVRYPELDEQGDFSDFMDRGGTLEAMFARPKSLDGAPQGRLTVSSGEFVAGFVPPDYLIVGWLQRRFIYSFTAATGDGKTAIALLITLLISQGGKIGKLECKQGRVLYFAGENPDDVRMRWMATTDQFGLTPEAIDNVFFVPGVFKFTEISERIKAEMAEQELALVIVDTSAAYFETDDENDNIQALAHAKRLRELSRLPGGPTVLICCHPTKNAETLVPRGGGAFLNEVDGNLTGKRNDLAVELYWTGKFRGPDFAPMDFELKVVTHERLVDTDGNLIRTVVARALSEEGLTEINAERREDQDKVLLSIAEDPGLSTRERARRLNWLTQAGDPYHTRVIRAERALEKDRLIAKERGIWELKDRGRKEVERLKTGANK